MFALCSMFHQVWGCRDTGEGKHIQGMCGSSPQILGNAIGDVGLFDRWGPSRNTKKIKLKYMETKT